LVAASSSAVVAAAIGVALLAILVPRKLQGDELVEVQPFQDNSLAVADITSFAVYQI
jgi:hypothetical protein